MLKHFCRLESWALVRDVIQLSLHSFDKYLVKHLPHHLGVKGADAKMKKTQFLRREEKGLFTVRGSGDCRVLCIEMSLSRARQTPTCFRFGGQKVQLQGSPFHSAFVCSTRAAEDGDDGRGVCQQSFPKAGCGQGSGFVNP